MPNNNYAIVQGPRNKLKQTYALEQVIRILLNSPKNQFFNNSKGEIYLSVSAEIGGEFIQKIDRKSEYIKKAADGTFNINITKILQAKPDFEQLIFNDDDLAKSEKYFWGCDSDTKPIYHKNLNPAEIYAIQSYSDAQTYVAIQDFLINKGSYPNKYSYGEIIGNSLNYHWAYLLITICIASHGLAKPMPEPIANGKLSRVENVDIKKPFFKSRLEKMKKKMAIRQEGFTSTSAEGGGWSSKNKNCHIIINSGEEAELNPIGKPIMDISVHKYENEVLFPPGTQFIVESYSNENNLHKFCWTPIRSIEDALDTHNKDKYSTLKKRQAVQAAKAQLMQIYGRSSTTSEELLHKLKDYYDSCKDNIDIHGHKHEWIDAAIGIKNTNSWQILGAEIRNEALANLKEFLDDQTITHDKKILKLKEVKEWKLFNEPLSNFFNRNKETNESREINTMLEQLIGEQDRHDRVKP